MAIEHLRHPHERITDGPQPVTMVTCDVCGQRLPDLLVETFVAVRDYRAVCGACISHDLVPLAFQA